MAAFNFDPSISVLFGPGRLVELGEQTRQLSSRSVLLVTDPGLTRTNIVERAKSSVIDAGLDVRVFDRVRENPTARDIESGLAVARSGNEIGLIVAVGGGSTMDCAKGINFLLTNGGRIEDYHGFGKANQEMLPSIGVPTTAGTGSEAQSYALISSQDAHVKMACGDRKARFVSVILDPDLIGSAPQPVKAAAGFDAMAHAVESYVCTKRSPVSRMYAREAFGRLDRALVPFVHGDPNADPGAVLLGAHLAGMAIEASMLGAAHACGNPLTAEYGATHGVAVGVMLPTVVAHNIHTHGDLYKGLAEHADLVGRLVEIRSDLGLPGRLSDLGVGAEAIPGLAKAASEQWTATFNPRPVDEHECRDMYEAAF